MKNILKGEKLSLDKEINSKSFIVALNWDQGVYTEYDIDSSVMLLSERGKLEEEGNFVFYNNPNSLNAEVKFIENSLSGFKKAFSINLEKVANDISKIMFLLTIDNGDALNQRFGNIFSLNASLVDEKTLQPVLNFKIEGMTKETAIIALELYKRNNEWKIQGVGNGFNSGLDAILKEYGSDKVQIKEEAPQKPPQRGGTFEYKKEEAEVKKTTTISLSKITLEKKGDSTKIDLTKQDDNKKEIHINLNWTQNTKKTGFFRKTERLDLDLGCMFEMEDGGKGVIQALGASFGARYTYPYIYLDKDDRSGVSSDGENLYISRPDLLKRAAIFAFIYEGNLDFLEADAVLKLKGINQEITVKLDSPRPNLKFCVGAYIENVDGIIKIQKTDEYVFSHKECDELFGFNFRWVAGSKD